MTEFKMSVVSTYDFEISKSYVKQFEEENTMVNHRNTLKEIRNGMKEK